MRKTTKLKLKKTRQEAKIDNESVKLDLVNHELVVLAAFLAGAQTEPADTEDIAIQANILAPGRFSWRKYKDQINIDTVRKRLWDATKNDKGAYLIGSEKTGWRLTKAGFDFAHRQMSKNALPESRKRRVSPPTKESVKGRMIQVLDTYGPIMDGEEFADKAVAAGINATTFYIYRMMSPVISALGKGIFCKVGCEVPPGTIEEIASRRKKVSRISDHGWTPAGKLWFGLELTRQTMVAGSVPIGTFVSDLVQGDCFLMALNLKN